MESDALALNAPLLLVIFEACYLVSLTAWLGSILFLTFGIVPILFRSLDKENGERFVRVLFPVYYRWGAFCAMIALPSLTCRALAFPDVRGWGIGIQALALMALMFLMIYCGQSLTPAINAARDQGAEGHTRFRSLHRWSEGLNLVAMIGLLALLLVFSVRPAPKASGIREWTPEEKARYDLELVDEIHRPRLKNLKKAEEVKSIPNNQDSDATTKSTRP